MEPLLTATKVSRCYNAKGLLPVILALAYLTIGFNGLNDYIIWDSVNFLIGIGALPLMLSQVQTGKGTKRFGWLALLFALAGLLMPVKTALYMALCCTFLFLFENSKGRVTLLPLLTLFLMSPVFQYFAHVFSFPVRLWLTDVAGNLLRVTGMPVNVAGNIITGSGTEFSVDPACMGLNMLVTSLLCGLILFAFYQKQYKLRLALGWVLAGLMILFVLNIAANLCRIILLVRFHLMPESSMHGLSGIICLIVYVLLPGALLCKILVKKWGRPTDILQQPANSPAKASMLHLFLLPVFVLAALRLQQDSTAGPQGVLPAVPGYTVSWYDKDIVKMEDATALIYLKPLKGFVYTDHNPLLCWTGSGYVFQNVEEQHWSGIPLFTGILKKDGEQLYTAWWYENGSTSTISQWTWRWLMLKGDRAFTIINISAESPEELQAAVARIAAIKGDLVNR
jgi:exosortase N